MATRNIVPRADEEGEIGTSSKKWNKGHYVEMNADSHNAAGEWKKQQYFSTVNLTDGTNISWDLSLGQITYVLLGGNRTLSNPTNKPNGRAVYNLIVQQDGTGSRTLAYGTDYYFSDGETPILTTLVSGIDVLSFIYDSTTSKMLGTILNDFS